MQTSLGMADMARMSGTTSGMNDLGWDLFSLQADHHPTVVATSAIAASSTSPGELREQQQAEEQDSSDWLDEPARLLALIECQRFETAIRELRALPPSLPQLPWLMGQLVLALAQAGMHDDTAELAAEMLARFPLRPEVTRTLVALAAILAVQGRVRQVFHPLGEAVVHTYAFSSVGLLEWAQRLAYQFRRHGNPEAAESILGALENVAMA